MPKRREGKSLPTQLSTSWWEKSYLGEMTPHLLRRPFKETMIFPALWSSTRTNSLMYPFLSMTCKNLTTTLEEGRIKTCVRRVRGKKGRAKSACASSVSSFFFPLSLSNSSHPAEGESAPRDLLALLAASGRGRAVRLSSLQRGRDSTIERARARTRTSPPSSHKVTLSFARASSPSDAPAPLALRFVSLPVSFPSSPR